MDRWHAMKVFVKVAESGGFAEAGRQLGMSPPAVTRAVAGLEDLVGARLMTRTTRVMKLTDVGARYLEDCRRILGDLAVADAAAAGFYATPAGLLVVTAPILFGRIYVLTILTAYLSDHPSVDGRALFVDRVVNLVDEGVDVAVRIGPLADTDLYAVRCGEVRRVICGSPDYFERWGEPRTPDDLASHRIIAATSTTGPLRWRLGPDRRSIVDVKPRLSCNTNEAAIAAAIDGWGLTRVLSYQVAQALKDGRLKIVLADHEPEPLPIHVVHTDGRGASAKVRSFLDFAVERLRSNDLLNGRAA